MLIAKVGLQSRMSRFEKMESLMGVVQALLEEGTGKKIMKYVIHHSLKASH
jgi:hypothetical protein